MWKVGDDPRTFDKKVSSLYFSAPGLYPVKLKVSKTFKDGTVMQDSVTRNFRIIRTEYHPIIGKYIGFNVSKPDSLFKFFIGHGSEGSFVWNVDTMKQFNANSSYVMTGLQGKMYSAHSVVLTSKGAWKDLTWDPLPKFANNFILKSVFIIPNARYDSIQIDYFKIKIPLEHPSGPELFTAEKFIGKRYF